MIEIEARNRSTSSQASKFERTALKYECDGDSDSDAASTKMITSNGVKRRILNKIWKQDGIYVNIILKVISQWFQFRFWVFERAMKLSFAKKDWRMVRFILCSARLQKLIPIPSRQPILLLITSKCTYWACFGTPVWTQMWIKKLRELSYHIFTPSPAKWKTVAVEKVILNSKIEVKHLTMDRWRRQTKRWNLSKTVFQVIIRDLNADFN